MIGKLLLRAPVRVELSAQLFLELLFEVPPATATATASVCC